MSYSNVLILMSDEHSNKVLGCHGHPVVKTPNLDRLASRGTRFANAYTNSPICIPARAALATGRYTFETGCWDNALAYHGAPRSWGHALHGHGIRSCSIGKLHYRSVEDDTGFTEQIMPMHVVDGVGDLLGAVRDPLPVRHKSRAIATEIGSGESTYTRYDRGITDAACDWLAANGRSSPWTLFVSWVAPHFPLIAPQAFYDLYDPAALPLPKASRPEEWPRHPWLDAFRECFITDRFFTDETRRVAIAAYYGLVSFLDHNVGRVLEALESSGVSSDTLVIYLSDHGDNLGTRGFWGKSTMYEESAAVPMMLAGKTVPGNRVVQTPVSLVDVHRTLMDAFGLPPVEETRGNSLLRLARAPDDPHRTVFSEYHAAGAATGAFMLRDGRYKYMHYVDMPPQLFDLQNDPEEMTDIAPRAECAEIIADFRRRLASICDPVAVDRRAKADQNALLARHGGREKIVAQGGFGATPAPGHKPQFE
ncbi:MAG: sulfatase-like hydrolase/transferase [Burkholderiales bacterium]|nr:sulfatase-like hydrolase/transferase [Burkholderiales bacterium]